MRVLQRVHRQYRSRLHCPLVEVTSMWTTGPSKGQVAVRLQALP